MLKRSRISQSQKLLGLQLGLGLLRLLILAWLPSLPLAIWQAKNSAALVAAAAIPQPLLATFFTLVVCFWLFALLPKGAAHRCSPLCCR